MFGRLTSLALLALLACSDEGDEQHFEAPPPGRACTPVAQGSPDPAFDPAHMLCVRLTMDAADFASLSAETRWGPGEAFEGFFEDLGDCTGSWPAGYTWFEADVEVDGVPLSRVGVRKKGFLGSVISGGDLKPSLKVKTDKHVAEQRMGDTERLTLNNALHDDARMRDCLAYSVFSDAAYPAPRCNLANVMVNGRSLGAYAHIEPIKKRFLKRAFGDKSGSLYEATLADLTPEFIVDFEEGQLGRWEAKTGDTDPSGLPIFLLTEALRAPDHALEAALGEVLDVDRFITFWALETLVNHADGYSGDRNNFFVYFDPTDSGRAVFVPWGVDKTFDDGSKFGDGGLSSYLRAELPRRLSRIPAMATRYEDELRRLLDEVWDAPTLMARVDAFAAQVATAQDDAGYDASVDTLRDWIRGREARVRAWLTEGLPTGNPQRQACLEGK